jgi:Zn-dependent protease
MIAEIAAYLHTDTLLFRVIAFVAAALIHDNTHIAAAMLLGDRNARRSGRLSLNPMAHIAPLGLAMVAAGPYGWTKPLPALTDRKWKRIVVFASAPAANMIVGIFAWWLYFALPMFAQPEEATFWAASLLRGILQYFIIVNLLYSVIHLIPLYPFDGWEIVKSLVKERSRAVLQQYEKYLLILTIALFVTPPGQMRLEQLYRLAAKAVMNIFAINM